MPEIVQGDALDILPTLDTASVDAIVTDPPYELGFMGRAWDGSGIAYNVDLWRECLRVLKPGGHLLAFGGTRTYHRMACAVEDAGFEIRDSISWLYGSGFPKSRDISKDMDRLADAEREVIGRKYVPMTTKRPPAAFGGVDAFRWGDEVFSWTDLPEQGRDYYWKAQERRGDVTAPATDAARQWQGWGTALKPGHEPIVVARKPCGGTVAATVLAYGTGALNIGACRVASDTPIAAHHGTNGAAGTTYGSRKEYVPGAAAATPPNTAGRWPANVVLDEAAAAELDAQTGTTTSSDRPRNNTVSLGTGGVPGVMGDTPGGGASRTFGYADSGGASRFFYCAKAPTAERPKADGVAHPTVKPLTLMRWLVRLVTPPGGTVLDPFAGSGTTLQAAALEGCRAIGVEREAGYLPLIRARLGEVAA